MRNRKAPQGGARRGSGWVIPGASKSQSTSNSGVFDLLYGEELERDISHLRTVQRFNLRTYDNEQHTKIAFGTFDDDEEKSFNSKRRGSVLMPTRRKSSTSVSRALRGRLRKKDSAGSVASAMALKLPGLRSVLNPDTQGMQVWELLMMVLVVTQAVYLPFTLAFDIDSASWMWVNVSIDVIFLVDIVIRFNLAVKVEDSKSSKFKEEHTLWVTKRSEIAKMYLSNWFAIDLLASIPLDFILVRFFDVSDSRTDLGKIARAARIGRLVKLAKLSRFGRASNALRSWLVYSRFANLMGVAKLILMYLFLVHYMTCMWWVVGMSGNDAYSVVRNEAGPGTEWIESLYMTMKMMTANPIGIVSSAGGFSVGDSDHELVEITSAQKVFTTFATFSGSLCVALLYGNVSLLISNYARSAIEWRSKMESVFEHMEASAMPMKLRDRVEEYYSVMFNEFSTLDGRVNSFIEEISGCLNKEIYLSMRSALITQCKFFRSCSTQCIIDLVYNLSDEVHLANDYIICFGQIGTHMYFIQRGYCIATIPSQQKERRGSWHLNVTKTEPGAALLPGLPAGGLRRKSSGRRASNQNKMPSAGGVATEKTVRQLREGDAFGEIGLLCDMVRQANIMAVSVCHLCVLSRDSFEQLCERHTELRAIATRYLNSWKRRFKNKAERAVINASGAPISGAKAAEAQRNSEKQLKEFEAGMLKYKHMSKRRTTLQMLYEHGGGGHGGGADSAESSRKRRAGGGSVASTKVTGSPAPRTRRGSGARAVTNLLDDDDSGGELSGSIPEDAAKVVRRGSRGASEAAMNQLRAEIAAAAAEQTRQAEWRSKADEDIRALDGGRRRDKASSDSSSDTDGGGGGG